MQESLVGNDIRWTWADFISSYRFWALIIFFIMMAWLDSLLPNLFVIYKQEYDLPNLVIGYVMSAYHCSFVLAIIPAWLMSRIKSYYPLHLLVASALLGVIVLYFALGNERLILCGALLIGFAIGATFLLIPAYIARAVNSVEVLVLAFGMLSLLKFFNNANFAFLIGMGMSINYILISAAVCVFIAALFLLPVKKSLFNELPPQRYVKVDNLSCCNSFGVFLLCFIPFYFIFWFYRVHKDIRFFTQASTLLTPQGAGFSFVFVPLGGPIMLSILNDNINQMISNKGQEAGYPTWLIILLGLFLPMLAVAMVQSEMNRLIELSKVDTSVAAS